MGLTAKPLLHHRQREDGRFRVQVRITKDRKSVFMDAGFTLPLRHWNPAGSLDKHNWVRATEPDAADYNKRLDTYVRNAQAMGRADADLSAEQARERLLNQRGASDAAPAPTKAPAKAAPGSPPTDFVAFADYYVRERSRLDKPNTVKFYREAARELTRWRAGEPLPFAALTERHLTDFLEWQLARPTVFVGTARDRLVKLGTIARRAVKLGVLKAERNPFPDFEMPKAGNKQPPRRPTHDEQQRVLHLDLSAVVVPRNKYPDYAQSLRLRRDIWELQYLIRGSRCGDILQLRERDVRPERISFTETKTGKLKNIARSPALNAILARYPLSGNPAAYLLPVLDHTRPYAAEQPNALQLELLSEKLRARIGWVNDGLRKLAELAGVPPFTSHSARHLFAERAYTKTKDMRTLQAMFNHSALNTTERYLQTLGYDALDEATERVLG